MQNSLFVLQIMNIITETGEKAYNKVNYQEDTKGEREK